MTNETKALLDRLQSIHDRALPLETPKSFFIILDEYLEIFISDSRLEFIRKDLADDMKEAFTQANELGEKAIKEMQEAQEKIKNHVQKTNLELPAITYSLNSFESYLNDANIVLDEKLKNMHSCLARILFHIREQRNNVHEKFLEEMEENENIDGEFCYSFTPNYVAWKKERSVIDMYKLTKPWYSWDELQFFFHVKHDFPQTQQRQFKEGKIASALGLSDIILNELQETKSYKLDVKRYLKAFDVPTYKDHLQRIHEYAKYNLSTQKLKTPNRHSEKAEKNFSVKGLYSLSARPLAIFYEGKNKSNHGWIYLKKGKTQTYAILKFASEKYQRLTNNPSKTSKNKIQLSLSEIEQYLKKSDNCDRPPSWKGILSEKRRLDTLLKNLKRIVPFTSEEVIIGELNNTYHLVFHLPA